MEASTVNAIQALMVTGSNALTTLMSATPARTTATSTPNVLISMEASTVNVLPEEAPRDLVLELSRRYSTLYEIMIPWKDFDFAGVGGEEAVAETLRSLAK
jgi:hypothetical protein